jgi:hypothetical protein
LAWFANARAVILSLQEEIQNLHMQLTALPTDLDKLRE